MTKSGTFVKVWRLEKELREEIGTLVRRFIAINQV